MTSAKTNDVTEPGSSAAANTQRVELSTRILLGLLAGIGCGLFFGEHCSRLAWIGDAFIGLLRMTILPYIAVALIANLGRLSMTESRRLGWIGGLVLLFLWSVAFVTVFFLSLGFPPWTTGSFFSSALVETVAEPDLLAYFVPANIFRALASNHVPAIVLFCISAGLALATVKDSAALIAQLDIAAAVLMRISGFITRLTPIGAFAIAASTAGTVSLNEVVRLQAYLLAYTGGAIFLGFLALPMLVTTLTPLTYRQVWRVAKEPMITAFATGKLIIVLPMLIQNTERLFAEIAGEASESTVPAVDVLYATAYPFPHVGKLLSMLFIPFAAWFLGTAISWSEYPVFLANGLFAYFGGPIVAIPYLLDQMQLPHDMFQLFLLSGVYGERLGDAVGAMHLVTFTLITTYAYSGSLRLNWLANTKYLLLQSAFGVIVVCGVRTSLHYSIGTIEGKSEIIAKMQLIEEPVANVVIRVPAPNPDPLQAGETLLKRIRRRGIIRIGFNEDKVPFAYFNEQGDLVGYDINMAHALARDLGVEIEFVRFDRSTLADQLRDDDFDVVMSGLVGTLERSEAMQHTDSYMDVNLALVVPDYRANEFKSLDQMRTLKRLRIGFVDLSRGFAVRLREALPDAELVEIANNRDFFEGKTPLLDAILISAESGSAFTLLYPGFEVVIPSEVRVKLPLFYAIGRPGTEMRDLLEHWITLRQKDGTAAEYYDHWILGRTAQSKGPRWSIVRDVLHWMD